MTEYRNIEELAHELTYHRYMLNQSQARGLIRELTVPEYIALQFVSHAARERGETDGRVYLRDVARELRLSIPQTSRMVGSLRDKGLVSWSHDGDGSEGTYLAVTPTGLALMERQDARLKEYYARVVDKFGRDNMAQLLQLMVRLEQVMDEERTEEGEDADE
ncbi:MAG: MarR family winged helix-turn-helix transcriptional regulator [Candidatus Spyradocola sp.]